MILILILQNYILNICYLCFVKKQNLAGNALGVMHLKI